jgi:porin
MAAPRADNHDGPLKSSARRRPRTKWMTAAYSALVFCLLPWVASANTVAQAGGASPSPGPAANPVLQAGAAASPSPTPAASAVPSASPPPAGWRAKLQSEGVTLRADYVGEFAGNTTGGKYRGAAYAQQIRFGTDLDLGKLIGAKGMGFHLTLNDRAGGGLTPNAVGNKLGIQEIYGAGQNFRLGEFTVDQAIAHNKVNVKLGFYAMGNDFGLTLLACNFINAGFCGHTQSLPNDSGWSDYPIAKWGARVRVNTSDSTYVETGAFETNPTGSLASKGWNTSLAGATGALVPLEVAWFPGRKNGKLPGEYKVGAYYDTSTVSDVLVKGLRDNGRFGAYVLASQMVYREPGRPGGLWLFAQGSYSDPSTALMQYYLDGGVVLTGTFKNRDRDTFGVGVVKAAVNPRALDAHSAPGLVLSPGEEVAEMTYGIGFSPAFLLRPGVQYVMNPGAFAFKNYGNAFVYELQMKATF